MATEPYHEDLSELEPVQYSSVIPIDDDIGSGLYPVLPSTISDEGVLYDIDEDEYGNAYVSIYSEDENAKLVAEEAPPE